MPRKYRFTDSHKSKGEVRQRHPLMAVDETGYRDLTFEDAVGDDGKVLTILDNDAVVRLELNAAALQWLIEELPENDRYTQYLMYARELAKFKLWDRAIE